MDDIYFLDAKIYFWLLLIIPVLVLVGIFNLWWKKRTQKKFAQSHLFKQLAPNTSTFKPILKLVFVCLAVACVAVALVNPKMGNKMETVKREGVDLVFAMDVSKSMECEDIAPNRLQKSQQLISEIINQLAGDRIGIIAYAGSAFPQLPITTDYASGRLFLQQLNTNMVSSQGTAITDAIELAKTYYNDKEQTNRILLLVSDGEGHEDDDVTSVAEEAAKEGIKIITIGVGTEKGGPIPIKQRGIVKSYKKDQEGETVITKLNPQTLKDISTEANGAYIDGTHTKQAVDQVIQLLQNMEKKEFESKQFADFKDQFQWFLGAALLFLLLDIFVLERRTIWVQKLDIFKEKNG